MFETQALVPSFPSPPMLIPCPGPQFTLCMYTLEHPVCIETQSSPAQSIENLKHEISLHYMVVAHTFYHYHLCYRKLLFLMLMLDSFGRRTQKVKGRKQMVLDAREDENKN
ncbi:hypothetical protein CsSME_00036932 [Camellia sinensis var. sinensis]